MVEPVSIGASILASSAANYVYSKGKRMHFLNEAVENAASQVAVNHEGLDSDVFIHIFQDEEVIELVEEFEDGSNLITSEDIADTFNDDLLGEEVEASPEELVLEFLNQLEVEISQIVCVLGGFSEYHYSRFYSGTVGDAVSVDVGNTVCAPPEGDRLYLAPLFLADLSISNGDVPANAVDLGLDSERAAPPGPEVVSSKVDGRDASPHRRKDGIVASNIQKGAQDTPVDEFLLLVD